MKREFLFLLIFGFQILLCQNAPQYQTPNMPTSPEVAKFVQYGNVPVNNFSGNASPSIPIYTIKEGGIEIPINLAYTSSGIRVSDQATWVGLGWELRPEGIITQEVRGRNDEFGMLNNSSVPEYQTLYDRLKVIAPLGIQKTDNQIGLKTVQTNCSIGNGQYVVCMNDGPSFQLPQDGESALLRLEEGHGQPDIFNFSFLGHEGEFYINPNTKELVQLNKKEEIGWQQIIGPYRYLATTNDGTKYYFDDKEVIHYNGNQAQPQFDNYTYKLSKIRLINGKEIFFDYIDGEYYNIYYTQDNNYESNLGGYDALQLISYIYHPPISHNYSSDTKILKRIRTDNVIVEFNLENREDTYPTNKPLKRIGSIDIISTSSGKKIKSHVFNYDYFPYSEDGFPNVNLPTNVLPNKDVFGKRLKLNNVSEIFYRGDGTIDSDKTQVHSFDYNTTYKLPAKLSFSKDFWGFYNGSSGRSLTPVMDYFINLGYTGGKPLKSTYNESANNKFANNLYKDTYMLNKITYPTKGYTAFEYESNTFKYPYVPTMQEEGSLSKIIFLNHNGTGGTQNPNPVHNFNLTQGLKVKFSNEIFRGIPNAPMQTQAYTYNQMVNAGASIKLYTVTNNQSGNEVLSIMRNWDLTSVLGTTFETTNYARWEEEIFLSPGNYRIVLYINNNLYSSTDLYHLAGVKSTLRYYAQPTQTISTQLGVRIANVKNYDSDNKLLQHKNYSYSDGIINNKFEFITPHYVYEFAPTQPLPIDITYYTIGGSDINSYVTYSGVEIKDVDTDSGAVKGSVNYNYWNVGNNTNILFPVRKNALNGLLLNEIVKDDNKNIIEKKYVYKNILNTEDFISIQSYKNYLNETPFCISKNNGKCYPKFTYYMTPLQHTSYKIDSLITKENLDGKILKTRQHFEYNNLGLVKRKEEIFDNSIISTEYKYTGEVGNYYLNQKDITGIPLVVETKKTVNGVTKPLSRVENYYPESAYDAQNMTSGLPLPYMTGSYGPGSQSEKIDIYYNRYDSKGNLLQYKTSSDHNGERGTPIAIIWGYNKNQPIAKVEGATYPKPGDPKSTDIPQTLIDLIVAASDTDASQGSGNDESALLIALDNFRKDPAMTKYQITTYTYDPLIGVRSITPPSGVRENYIYDTANKLEKVVDINGHILKEYKYNYKQ
ncbi:hypothetical protein [Epilithonimonas caeni]|uniref:hypothetical protein n=1 Tax=Epilithonimonas caeni TaxID=365343 RepID=UPI00041F5E58|nr:hypothetical protein [Epilithonimonas caeni]